jgi:hypothetical protein
MLTFSSTATSGSISALLEPEASRHPLGQNVASGSRLSSLQQLSGSSALLACQISLGHTTGLSDMALLLA